MRIAVISDVHSNLPALQKFLEIAKQENVEKIWCAGDIVGYNPYPEEVVEIFMREKIPSVMGNHDWAVANNDFTNFNWAAAIAGKWTRERLGATHLAFLASLPEMLRFEVHGKKICICHGSPEDRDCYVYPFEATKALLEIASADLLILGHTHVQFVQKFDRGIILNPGSIGQPRDGIWEPGYAIIEIGKEGIEVSLKRFEYALEEVVKKFGETELPEALANRLYYGR